MKKLLLCFALFLSVPCYGHTLTNSHALLAESKQLILLVSPTSDSYQATIQRYARDKDYQWVKVGEKMPAEIGKKGMAWDKQEGDLKTPIGIFKMGSLFGFGQSSINTKNFPYFNVGSTVCVDDKESQYYNQVLDGKSVVNPDWHSSEILKDVPEYEWGSVIEYNMHYPAIKGAGSCIFMHLILTPYEGTHGCVALTEPHLKEILTWLDPNDNPVIALFSESTYQQLKEELGLPNESIR